jgi:hypothetical protein
VRNAPYLIGLSRRPEAPFGVIDLSMNFVRYHSGDPSSIAILLEDVPHLFFPRLFFLEYGLNLLIVRSGYVQTDHDPLSRECGGSEADVEPKIADEDEGGGDGIGGMGVRVAKDASGLGCSFIVVASDSSLYRMEE